MINFVSKYSFSFNFGKLLTVSELIERRKKSSDGILRLYGYLQVYKGKLYKVSPYVSIIDLKSNNLIEEHVLGPLYLRGRSVFNRTIVFTNREKLESFLGRAINSEYKFINADLSQYFTEVYD